MARGPESVDRVRPGSGFALRACVLLLMLPAASGAGEGEFAQGDPDSCLMCHTDDTEHPAAGIVHSAHAGLFGEGQRQCQSCHGPSEAHFGRREDGTRPPPAVSFGPDTPAREADAVCLDCHEARVAPHWSGSAHEFEEVACTDCHALHAPGGDPVLEPEGQAGVCFDCHERERAELMRPHRHPVAATPFTADANLLTCSDCHDPHGSGSVASLNRLTLNETCYDCHAELRGPFVWEHAPVREDCSACHVPHGSVHDALLRQRPPQLCQQCHLAQFHPGTVRSGRGLPPQGADANLLGQSCMNCHTAVHGSNHPSSPGFTR